MHKQKALTVRHKHTLAWPGHFRSAQSRACRTRSLRPCPRLAFAAALRRSIGLKQGQNVQSAAVLWKPQPVGCTMAGNRSREGEGEKEKSKLGQQRGSDRQATEEAASRKTPIDRLCPKPLRERVQASGERAGVVRLATARGAVLLATRERAGRGHRTAPRPPLPLPLHYQSLATHHTRRPAALALARSRASSACLGDTHTHTDSDPAAPSSHPVFFRASQHRRLRHHGIWRKGVKDVQLSSSSMYIIIVGRRDFSHPSTTTPHSQSASLKDIN